MPLPISSSPPRFVANAAATSVPDLLVDPSKMNIFSVTQTSSLPIVGVPLSAVLREAQHALSLPSAPYDQKIEDILNIPIASTVLEQTVATLSLALLRENSSSSMPAALLQAQSNTISLPAVALAHWLNPFSHLFETDLENILGIYRLTPSIKHNKEFMEAILNQYGVEITDKLIEAHPFIINKPDGKIDLKTVIWFVSELEYTPLDPENIKRLIYIPFWNENKTTHSNYLATLSSIEASLTLLYPSFTDKLLFEDLHHYDAFFYEFEKNDFELPVNIIKKRYDISDLNLAKEIAVKTIKMIKTKKLYLIDPTDIPKDDYILSIVGHGKPGEVVIASDAGVNGERILLTAKEVADKINTERLNSASRLDLIICSSAATKYPSLEEEEAKKAFLNNTLRTHFVDDDKIETSFLYQFSKSIFEIDPSWQGHVVGSYGVLSMFPIDTFIRDPENLTKLIKEKRFSSEVVYQGYLGKYYTAFDKEALSKTYLRSDFL